MLKKILIPKFNRSKKNMYDKKFMDNIKTIHLGEVIYGKILGLDIEMNMNLEINMLNNVKRPHMEFTKNIEYVKLNHKFYFYIKSIGEILFLIKKESFLVLYPYGPNDYLFNFPTREFYHTRNMSYDIRGEPVIPYYNVSPFNNPEYPVRYYPRELGYVYNYYVPPGVYPPIFATLKIKNIMLCA